MTGRIPFGLLTLLTALVCAPIQAQDQMGPPPGNGVQPAGFHAFHETDVAGQYHGFPLNYQRSPVRGTPGPPAQTIYEELPDDLGFAYDDTRLGKILTETFRHAWFRSEYLLWDASAPGHVLLGEQTATGVPHVPVLGEPVNRGISHGIPFPHTIQLNGGSIAGQSIAPGLDDFSINNMNGFRGTFGLPFPVGQLELSSFVLGASSASFDANDFIQGEVTGKPAAIVGQRSSTTGQFIGTNPQTAQFISQPSRLSGALSDTTFIDYDISYKATLTTSSWGSEGNFVVDSPDPNSPFQFRPSFGLRYFNFRDRLNQFGQYNETGVIDPVTGLVDLTKSKVVTREINSSSNNDLVGPQIGVRAELTHSRFLIGVEPKIMFGFNSWKSSLDNANVFGSTDVAQSLLTRGTTFSPLFDAKFYSNVSLTKNLSAYVAYNYLWAGQLNLTYNDIVYNKNAAGHADFQLKRQYSSATLQGLSFGIEFRY